MSLKKRPAHGRWQLIALIFAASILALPAACAETIMDQLGILRTDFDTANGNAIGGENLWGRRTAIQVADDFRATDTGHVVTEVTVGNLTYFGVLPQDARISIFEKADDRPAEEAVYSARASELGLNVINERFTDGVFGLQGVLSSISGLEICLLPNHEYYLDVQVYSSSDDWAYTVRDNIPAGTDSFLRDGPVNEGEGGYGFTEWRSAGDADYGAGDSAYRIEATSGTCCTGSERIAKARCRAGPNGNKLTIRLVDGFPGDAFTVRLSSGDSHSGTLDAAGKARARFKRPAAGEGTAAATWGCGATDEKSYPCP
ncbi:MAG: hypothetical protein IT449_05415 [Phycisphaerales bacterium]|nr:hypothetical protein [Phycisphaerales bacterium]